MLRKLLELASFLRRMNDEWGVGREGIGSSPRNLPRQQQGVSRPPDTAPPGWQITCQRSYTACFSLLLISNLEAAGREGESIASTNLRAERGLAPPYFSQEPVSEAVQPPRLLEEDLKSHHLLEAFSSKR